MKIKCAVVLGLVLSWTQLAYAGVGFAAQSVPTRNSWSEIQAAGETVVADKIKPESGQKSVSPKVVKRVSQSTLFSDAVSSLKLMPGVASRGTFDSRLIIRGGNDNELVMVLDDVPMFRPFIFGGRLSLLDARIAKSLDFYPGGFSVRGGQSLSGIIDYHLLDGDFYKKGGEFEWNLTEASFKYSNPVEVGKSTVFVAGRRTYYDVVASLFVKSSDGPVAMPFFQTLETKFTDKVSPSETRRLAFHYFNDGAKTPLNSVGSSDSGQLIYNNARMMTSAQQEINWTPTLRNQATIAFQNVRSRARLTNDQQVDSTTEESDYIFRDDVIWTDIPNHEIRFGGITNITNLGLNNSQQILPDPDVPGSVTRNASLVYSGTYIYGGTYLEDNWSWTPDSVLTLGYRVDAAHLDGQNVKWAGQPRMAVAWNADDTTKWKAYWGAYRQHKIELDTRLLPNGTLTQSFSNVAQDRAIHYGIGLEKNLNPSLLASVELFYKKYDLLSVDTGKSPEVIFTNDAEGSALGAEFLLHQFKTDQLEGWVTYTYTNARLMTPKRGWHSPDYDIPHVLNVFAEFSQPNGTITTVFTASSGMRYTPVLGSQIDSSTGASIYTYGDYLSKQFTPYVRLDVWAEQPGASVVLPIPFLPADDHVLGIFPKYSFKGKSRIGIYNILGFHNIIGYSYDKDKHSEIFVSDFPFMPIFGQTIDL